MVNVIPDCVHAVGVHVILIDLQNGPLVCQFPAEPLYGNLLLKLLLVHVSFFLSVSWFIFPAKLCSCRSGMTAGPASLVYFFFFIWYFASAPSWVFL